MESESRRRKRGDNALSSLNAAIIDLHLVRDRTTIKSAKDVLNSANFLLTTIRVGFPQLRVFMAYRQYA
jgi:hypothetical protein